MTRLSHLDHWTSLMQEPVLPGAHSIERYLIEEQLHKIIHKHHLERKDW